MTHGEHSNSVVKKRRRPRFPFWKDEKIFGTKLTAAGSLRAFVIAVVIGFVVIAFEGIYIIDLNTKITDTIKTGRINRITDQNTYQQITDRKIRDLVCFAVDDVPPGKSTKADQLRGQYACGPYKKGANASAVPSPKNSSTPGTATGNPPTAPVPNAKASSSSKALSGTPSGLTGATSSSALPSHSIAPVTSTSPTVIVPPPAVNSSMAPLINLGKVTCVIVNIFC